MEETSVTPKIRKQQQKNSGRSRFLRRGQGKNPLFISPCFLSSASVSEVTDGGTHAHDGQDSQDSTSSQPHPGSARLSCYIHSPCGQLTARGQHLCF